jgi:hypothetical protein
MAAKRVITTFIVALVFAFAAIVGLGYNFKLRRTK